MDFTRANAQCDALQNGDAAERLPNVLTQNRLVCRGVGYSAHATLLRASAHALSDCSSLYLTNVQVASICLNRYELWREGFLGRNFERRGGQCFWKIAAFLQLDQFKYSLLFQYWCMW